MSPLVDLLWVLFYCTILLFFVIHIGKILLNKESHVARIASVAGAIKSWKPIRYLVPYFIVFFVLVFYDLARQGYPASEHATQFLRIAVVIIFWIMATLVPNWKKETYLMVYCIAFLWFSGMVANEFCTLIENAYFGGLSN